MRLPVMTIMLAVAALAAVTPGTAQAEQVFLLTDLGNMFPVEPHHLVRLPEGTVGLSPHLVQHTHDGFFIIGDPADAQPLVFGSAYHVPSVVAGDGRSVYALVRGDPQTNTIPNHDPHWYDNGRITLSTNGLDHVLRQALPSRSFSGEPAYWPGSGYLTFHGNGTAAHLLRTVTHNGVPVDHFLVEAACPGSPCGSVLAAKSHDRLLIFGGNLTDARLYDTVRLGSHPRVITQEHYLIADTTSGDVRVRAVAYDDSRLEIRNLPRGTAYLITGAGQPLAPYGAGPSAPWWPAAWAAHGCCYTNHTVLPAFRAGLQAGTGTITYDSDVLAEPPGGRGDVLVRTYTDEVLWRQARLAGGWLLFDHHNDRGVRLSGTPERVVSASMYVKVPSASGTTLSEVGLARHDCAFHPKGLGYLWGRILPGGSASIPVVPGYPMVCLYADGIPAVIRYAEMAEETETIPLRPDSSSGTISGEPASSYCSSCGYTRWHLESAVEAASHATTISPRDGPVSVSVSGFAEYRMNVTRTWSSTYGTLDVSHWAPGVTIQDEGGATISVYRNGILADSLRVPCEASSEQRTARSATSVSGTSVHHWSWTSHYSCVSRIDAQLTILASAGDIIDVALSVRPDILVHSAGRDAAGAADAGYERASVSGILVKSYG